MTHKYIKNYSDTEATLLLHGEIGYDINGFSFASELLFLEDIGIKTCTVSIVSGGGRVDQAFAVFQAIVNSKMHIECRNDGIAYSSAGWIWLAGDKSTMTDYAQWMCHNASVEGEEDPNPELTQMFSNSIAKIIAGKTGVDEIIIKEWMDKETFMDSSTMLNHGLVNQEDVYPTTVKKSKPQLIGNSVKDHYSICSKFLNSTQEKKHTMTKVNKLLNLSAEASEEAVETAVEGILSDKATQATTIETLEKEKKEQAKEIAALKATVSAFETKDSEAKELAAIELVENGFKDGKYDEAAKVVFLNFAKSDFEGAKTAIESIKVANGQKTHVNIIAKTKNVVVGGVAGREEWTIRDWEIKDPKGLGEIKNSNPSEYDRMFNAFYTKKSK